MSLTVVLTISVLNFSDLCQLALVAVNVAALIWQIHNSRESKK